MLLRYVIGLEGSIAAEVEAGAMPLEAIGEDVPTE